MNMLKKLPPPSKSDKRMLVVSALIFVASCVLVILAVNNRNTPSPLDMSNRGGIGTSVPAEVVKLLTALPSAPALTGPVADEVHALSQMVASCPDYSQERRDQMNQHIDWMLNPSKLPKEVVIALGTNINGRLMFGMATYTLSEWGQHQKSTSSCLLTIGKKLNELLVANGEARFAEFDGS